MAESLFFDYLSQLLGYTSADAGAVSAKIADTYRGHSALATAELDEIESIADEKTAHLIRLCYALAERRITDSFRFGISHTEQEIVRYFKAKFYVRARETSYVMLFDKNDKVIGCEYLGDGTVNFLAVSPRRVLEVAVKKKAASVIIAHNHPGGLPNPSCEDIEATHAIAALFEESGRRVRAHYVFAGDKHGVIIPTQRE